MTQTLLRTIVVIVLFAIAAPSLAEDTPRYWASMRDGTVETGRDLEEAVEPPYSVTLDGDNLTDSDRPVRTVWDTSRTPTVPDAYVEMTSGDVLAGRVARAVTGAAAFPLPDHLVVEGVRYTGKVRVRLDWVRTIVSRPRRVALNRQTPLPAVRSRFTPMLLKLANGSQVDCRAIRWSDSNVKVLSAEKSLSIPLADVMEMHLPRARDWQPLFPGSPWLRDRTSSIVRLTTVAGQVITFPAAMMTTGMDRKRRRLLSPKDKPSLFAVKPAWSLDALVMDPEELAFQTFLDAGETPLAVLPVVDAVEKSAIHHYPWRRDRSVRGGELQSGDRISESGLGMAAYSRLTFQLPPHAEAFTAQVGLNQKVGAGGCVHVRVWRGEATGSPIWEREFLRGKDGLQQVGPLDIRGAQRLILEVDFAHENRPEGADPLDIRDQVDWLMPIVSCATPKDDLASLHQAIPEIKGWSISKEMLRQIELRPFWIRHNDQFGLAIGTGSESLTLSRQARITLENAWLPVNATCDEVGGTRSIGVQVDGEKVNSTGRGSVTTFSRGRFGGRVFPLSRHAGRTVTVEVVADAHKRSQGELGGVVFDWLRLQPLVGHLPTDGEPIRPEVSLTKLTPLKATRKQKPLSLVANKLSNGDELNLQRWWFNQGFGAPAGSSITYRLDPSWRTFVAIIGFADGWSKWREAGPYQILLDGELHWSSDGTYTRDDPAEQISVPIPMGHQTITLRIPAGDDGAAWAHAGFLK